MKIIFYHDAKHNGGEESTDESLPSLFRWQLERTNSKRRWKINTWAYTKQYFFHNQSTIKSLRQWIYLLLNISVSF